MHQARARALSELGAQDACQVGRGDRSGWAGEKDVFTLISVDHTLEQTLWRMVEPQIAQPGAVREMAKADALTDGRGCSAIFGALCKAELWIQQHVEAVARATPDEKDMLIRACKYSLPFKLDKQPILDRIEAALS